MRKGKRLASWEIREGICADRQFSEEDFSLRRKMASGKVSLLQMVGGGGGGWVSK